MTQEEHDSRSLFEERTPKPSPEAESEAPAGRGGKVGRIAVIAALAIVLIAVAMLKNRNDSGPNPGGQSASAAPGPSFPSASGLPRFIEIGSVSCIPCKMMAPVLEELRKEYAGVLQVDFIDVNTHPEAAAPFRWRLIPTQVFLDAEGNEVFRHVGFFPKEEILAKWKELGVNLEAHPQ